MIFIMLSSRKGGQVDSNYSVFYLIRKVEYEEIEGGGVGWLGSFLGALLTEFSA